MCEHAHITPRMHCEVDATHHCMLRCFENKTLPTLTTGITLNCRGKVATDHDRTIQVLLSVFELRDSFIKFV